jgi:hypothetical protein
VAPLTDAIKGDKKAYQWGRPQKEAFVAIKRAFTSAPVLRLPDPEKPFVVTTDASNYGIGGVLEQEWEDGSHPLAYVSRNPNDAEKNYPTHDREFLAIVDVVKELRCYLHVSAFVVRADLTLFGTCRPNPTCPSGKYDGWTPWLSTTIPSSTLPESGMWSQMPCHVEPAEAQGCTPGRMRRKMLVPYW